MSAVVEISRPCRDDAAWNLFVFRKARESLASEHLRQQLLTLLRSALTCGDHDGVLNALVRAGEVECALADLGSPDLQSAMQAVDALAAIALPSEVGARALDVVAALQDLPLPATISLSHAEGFSYYGLHPLDFWDLGQQVRFERSSAAVVGIRSIGTTLSSIVCQAARSRGIQAERITVRPAGPPYHRRLQFAPEQLRWIAGRLALDSEFVVVDEGPGFSGSSFSAVGRALRQAGVPNQRILFMGSRIPQSAELQSRFDPDWSSFRFCSVVQGTRIPANAKIFCAGGYWRQSRFPRLQEWPACWTHLERNKYFSPDSERLFKFEGFGRFGQAVYQRSQALAAAGFAPPVLGYENGFVEYATLDGQPMSAPACERWTLERLAEYCAFRTREQKAAAPGPVSLESMLALNLNLEFGLESFEIKLPLERLVTCDSRMMPHEWIACNGRMFKTDGASHGDDHLFPGPTDIAWDLAGVIAEWGLGQSQQEFFLREYRRRSGDDAARRVPAYLLAYSVFRMACCRMGAAAMATCEDSYRLERAYRRHRRRVLSLLGITGEGRGDARLFTPLPCEHAA